MYWYLIFFLLFFFFCFDEADKASAFSYTGGVSSFSRARARRPEMKNRDDDDREKKRFSALGERNNARGAIMRVFQPQHLSRASERSSNSPDVSCVRA
jgi:hypothetical protein